ncbi:S24 family peptidase [Aliarcobacter butzleri]|uniref:S24 family peptidase n=1 Tax=Aliarcobacter butzleri TaxID=28197 RepID=UPI0021B3B462|nr:S24 family peptidase [Aliarcobacter butzleri]MCT7613512.1 S24 family peptidase [Aliarcobacter butzleri]MCT7642093.1 S24 family peptidase [Aliarcobacter butzleri]
MDIELELKQMIKKGNFKNQKEFSKWALVSESYITKWKNQGYIPDEIKEKFESEFGELIYNNKINESINVNLYKDVYASAGYGTTNSELVPTKMTFDREFLKEIFNITNFNNLDIIRVIGDSMLPHIKDGEFIFIQKDTQVKNGDTVIANIDGELYVKRYYKIPFEKWIKLESDNPDYPCINLDTDEKLNSFKIIGIVKSKIKLY